ncbi:MAG: polysaccharide biosynthesis/export family protein, partial [Algoriphagus sp.]
MNTKNFKNLIPFSILAIVLFSCVSNKKVIYMQELEESTGPLVESSNRYGYQVEDYLLQANDILEISIKTTDPALNAIFNVVNADENNASAMAGGQGAGDAFFMNGYSLDDYGNVEIPLVGVINLLGLTTNEVKALVETKVQK